MKEKEFERRWLVMSKLTTKDALAKFKEDLHTIGLCVCYDYVDVTSIYLEDNLRYRMEKFRDSVKYLKTKKYPIDRFSSEEITEDINESEFFKISKTDAPRINYLREYLALEFNLSKLGVVHAYNDYIFGIHINILELEFKDINFAMNYELPNNLNFLYSELMGGNTKLLFAN